MELFKLIGRIVVDDKKAKESIKGTEDQARRSEGKISSAFKKIGAAAAVYFSFGAIKDFGKAIVNAAADVQAENAQFEASFKDLQGTATEMFRKMGEDLGILDTRLRGVGTKAFAQFTGAGLEATDAMKETDRYTRLAADAAAYYDISLEEADGKLRSFLRGNTEAGDSIGLFTSESQRNAAAMEAYGAQWTKLTEAQKQMLMLSITEDIYKQSGAIGQANRESDAYENTVGNLKESWRQFQAIVGAPVLQALIPILQKVTQWLGTGGEKIKEFISNFKMSGEASGALQKIMDVLRPIYDSIVTYVLPAVQQFISALVSGLMPVAETVANVFTTYLLPVFQKIGEDAPAMFQKLGEVISEVASIIQPILMGLATALQFVWGFIGPFVTDILMGIWDAVKNVFNGVLEVISGVVTLIKGIFTGDWAMIWEGAKQILFGAVQAIWGIVNLWIVGKLVKGVGTALKSVKTFFTNIWTNISNFFKGIGSGIANTAKSFIDTVRLRIMYGLDAIKAFWSSVWNAIRSVASSVWNGIRSVISGAINAVRSVISGGVNGIRSSWSSAWNAMKSLLNSVWNGMKSGVKSGVSAVLGFVRSLPGKIRGVFSGAGSMLLGAGKNIINGLLRGITNGFGAVKSKLSELTNLLPDWKGPAKKDKTLLTENGQLIIDGFTKGLESRFGGVKKKLGDFTNDLTKNADLGEIAVKGNMALSNTSVAETILPSSQVEDTASATQVLQLDQILALLNRILPAILEKESDLYLDSGELVGALSEKMDESLGDIAKRKGRGNR